MKLQHRNLFPFHRKGKPPPHSLNGFDHEDSRPDSLKTIFLYWNFFHTTFTKSAGFVNAAMEVFEKYC